MRTKLTADLKAAMIAKDAARLSTLRLINAAIKDKEIAMRADGGDAVTDDDILGIMTKMIKQRRDSVTAYEEAGRLELAEKEQSEIAVIEEYLPKQMSDEEIDAAVAEAIADTGADSIRDMGKVMGALKSAYAGQMDFGKAGGAVKAKLG